MGEGEFVDTGGDVFVFGLPVFVEGFSEFEEAFLADRLFEGFFGGVETVGESRGSGFEEAFGRFRALAFGAVDPGGFGAAVGVFLQSHSFRLWGGWLVTDVIGF